MKLGDRFPDSYFDGSSLMKKEFINELLSSLNPDQLLTKGRSSMASLIDSALISDFSKDFCKACFAKAPDEFFILPTATTGKYHGGRDSLENCIGGNIIHTKNVLGMSPKVLNRYKEMVDDSSAELLKVSCLLHDICKIPKGGIYTLDTHGEEGTNLIQQINENIEAVDNYIEPIKFAVANHMYLWRFQNVWNQITSANDPFTDTGFYLCLLVGLMLAECDYYSF